MYRVVSLFCNFIRLTLASLLLGSVFTIGSLYMDMFYTNPSRGG